MILQWMWSKIPPHSYNNSYAAVRAPRSPPLLTLSPFLQTRR
jgi:hypothetical protein